MLRRASVVEMLLPPSYRLRPRFPLRVPNPRGGEGRIRAGRAGQSISLPSTRSTSSTSGPCPLAVQAAGSPARRDGAFTPHRTGTARHQDLADEAEAPCPLPTAAPTAIPPRKS